MVLYALQPVVAVFVLDAELAWAVGEMMVELDWRY